MSKVTHGYHLAMSEPAVTTEIDGDVAVIRIDDGKANALGHGVIDGIGAALDRATSDALAVVIVGRPDRFSAGFDLEVMRGGREAVTGLVGAGARLFARIYTLDIPVVAACTGHAVAAGAILLMASDVRIGADGDYKIGLPEVTIGMVLPQFAVDLAQDRLSRRHVTAATMHGRVYSPVEATDVGFLDRVVAPEMVESEARAAALQLAGSVNRQAFAATRRNVRAATADKILTELEADLAAFFVDQ